MISSSRIKLTKLLESDISLEYLETLNDSNYMKYSRNSTFTHTLNSQLEYISNFDRSNNLLFGIKKIADGRLLGSVNCFIDFSKMTLDLGFLIFRNEQGKGYASEALGLLVSYLSSQFPGMSAVIGSHRENFAMHQVAEKHNFKVESSNSRDTGPNLMFIRRFPKANVLTQPAIPDFILNANRIGVAAHDAGGAEQISWLLRNLPHNSVAYLDGPAKRIFENSKLKYQKANHLSDALDCDLLITGSGWMSQLEVTAISEASLRGIPCVTILDHWVNYKERFEVGQVKQPRILAVTNSIALRIAQEHFPSSVVWLLPDFQIDNYRQAINDLEQDPCSLLVLLEPVLDSTSKFAISEEIIENLLDSANLLQQYLGLKNIIVRPHPSQKDDSWIIEKIRASHYECEISDNVPLLEDLGISKVVLGLNSYAMYISAMCGIKTYSYFAGRKGHWTENFPMISLLLYPL